MSELNGQTPPDEATETYVLTDEEHLRCLVAGATQLGVVPLDRLSRVRRVRFEQVSNGAMLCLWLRTAPALPVPPLDPESIRRGLLQRLEDTKPAGPTYIPTVKQIARWSRAQLEQVMVWLESGAGDPLPDVLVTGRRTKRSEPPGRDS
jgi:hypothetical protein